MNPPLLTPAMSADEVRTSINDTLARHATLLASLETAGRSMTEKQEVVDKLIPELRQTVAQLRESQTMGIIQADPTGPESELRRFVRADGSLRVRGEVTTDDAWQDGILDSRESHGWWHRDLKQLVTLRSIVRTRSQRGVSPKVDRMLANHVRNAPPMLARIFGATGSGAEWIPSENMVPDIDRAVAVMAEGRIAGLFQVVPMSTEVLTVPFATTGGTPYVQGEPVDNPAQYTATIPGSAARQHTSKTFALRYQLDNDSTEDAIIDTYGELSTMIASDMVDGEEDAIINGDTAATHQDTGIASWNPNGRWSATTFGGAADHRKAWIGLRARAFDVSNTWDQSGSQTYDGCMDTRSRLQARSRRAAFIANEKFVYGKMMTFSQVQANYSTVGMVQDGRVVNLGGVPVYISFFLTADKAATGLFTGSGTYTELICADLDRFRRYIRRGAMVELQRDITRGVTDMVSTWRGTFKTNDASTAKNVALGYKLLS